MPLHPQAGKIATKEMLENIPKLISSYYTLTPDIDNIEEQVSFGTSGHRGTSLKNSFNEAHILAISQAIVEYRKANKIDGMLFLGLDTHALSEPARISAIEVFGANGIEVRWSSKFTPTPVISQTILSCNAAQNSHLCDGVVITPSHNPPSDGGFKYNPPNGGPAGVEITNTIQKRANEIIKNGLKDVKRVSIQRALKLPNVVEFDFITPYISELKNVIDMKSISDSKLKIGVDCLGGSGFEYWEPIAEMYNIELDIINNFYDPTFSFMSVDKDGKIRMDCSSSYAMASLIKLKDRYDIAFGNDPDYDRHGIVTSDGLMNPNHYLSVAIEYLFSNRERWSSDVYIGKTLVSSSMIDRVAKSLNRELKEVPVGFKWFVDGLLDGSCGFGGEESAGASFLRIDGSVWSSDKDGIILDLLSAEITAKSGKNPSEHYKELEKKFGSPIYKRIDAPATSQEKSKIKALNPNMIKKDTLAGEKIEMILTKAPGNGESIGGLKVVSENGWFAARPSGTEEIYKIYAESFIDNAHLDRILDEAKETVDSAIK